jgi:DnaJ-class molecular chaperone
MNYQEACTWLQLDPRDESLDEASLKRAFRRIAMQEHPDKSNHSDATRRFQNVQQAQELVLQQIQLGRTGKHANLKATLKQQQDTKDEDKAPSGHRRRGYYGGDDEEEDMPDILEHIFMAHLFSTNFSGHGRGRGFRTGLFSHASSFAQARSHSSRRDQHMRQAEYDRHREAEEEQKRDQQAQAAEAAALQLQQ